MNSKSKTCTELTRNAQNLKWVGFLAVLLAGCVGMAEAQQSAKVYRIGYLSPVTLSSDSADIETFRRGLRDLGYIEGQNIAIEYRFAEGKPDRLPDLMAELLRLKVDVIFARGTSGVQAAKKATTTVPLVTISGDPVAAGFVASLARPGGNITGLTNFTSELGGKRLELLKEVVPQVARVAVLWYPDDPLAVLRMRETENAGPLLGLKLQPVDVRGPNDFDLAFSTMKRERAGAFVVLRAPLIINRLKLVVELAAKNLVPAMYDDRDFTEAGGLMSYGTSIPDLYRRAAIYVDKILKGAKPADLPVEQPTKFELIINLKAAKHIGLTIPPNVLARADKVIR
jgi:putative tryptophan/tyrosine transport system substrate-binding protein